MDDPEANHNGGNMQFGPDGLLYIGTGDGGGAGDRHGANGNGQSLSSPLGKLLRIDPRESGGRAYTIPARTPSAAAAGVGRSTPTGCATPGASRSTARPGDIVIADVGQDSVEEVDFMRRGKARGANFGWRDMGGRASASRGTARARSSSP